MKIGGTVIVAILFSYGLTIAQEKIETAASSHTMIGYLVDQMCSKRMVMDDVKKSDAKAARHTKDCALEDGCRASGFGIMNGGKFYKFDSAGNKKAEEYLNTTKKENNLKVVVAGTMDGDKLMVVSVKDYKAPMKKTAKRG